MNLIKNIFPSYRYHRCFYNIYQLNSLNIQKVYKTTFKASSISNNDKNKIIPKEKKIKLPLKKKKNEKFAIEFEDISRALFRIHPHILVTPTVPTNYLSSLTGSEIYLKKEYLQVTGSFKERGTRNALMKFTDEQKEHGVKTASAGNHALSLAYHGAQMGIKSVCVMPLVAPLTKIQKCKKYGAEVEVRGEHFGEARSWCENSKHLSKMTYLDGYNHPDVIAGTGTIGLEILEQLPDVDVIVVPVGGGGLIAGISLAVKTVLPHVKIIGVEPTNASSFTNALKNGKPLHTDIKSTLADGLAVPFVGQNGYDIATKYIDEIYTIDEKLIALALLRIIEGENIVVEGGGAIALAALLPGGPLYKRFPGKKVVLPVCGGNIDITTVGRVIERGLAADYRLVRFAVPVSDRPGGIAQLTKAIADIKVSIKEIQHERAWLDQAVDQVMVKAVVETMDKAHTLQMRKHLENLGYKVIWDDIDDEDDFHLL